MNIDNKTFLKKLKEVININDLEKFVDTLFLGDEKLSHNKLCIKSSNRNYKNVSVNLNRFLGQVFRIYFYCKVNGCMGIKPQNTGESTFFSKLYLILKAIESVSVDNEITSMSDITEITIENAIKLMFKQGQCYRTVKMKLSALKLIIKENDKFPELLTIFPSVISKIDLKSIQREVVNIDDEDSNIRPNLQGVVSNVEQYDLKSMQILVSNSKKIFEYKEELIDLLKIIVEAMKSKNSIIRAKYVFEELKKDYYNGKKYKFDIIEKWQKKIVKTDNFYCYKYGKYKGRKLSGRYYSELILATEYFEASCLVLSLIGTAMRSSEFINLPREVKFTEGEHLGLTRLIFKTSDTEKGTEYNNPIPRVCREAIETLIRISDIKDNRTNNFLNLGSVQSIDKNLENTNNQRLNLLLYKIAKYSDLLKSPTTHQFRHLIAYLVASSDDTYGLEIASMLLGHKSTKMTLQYLASFNKDIEFALVELNKMNSNEAIEKICNAVAKGEKLFGIKAELLMPDISYTGKIIKEFSLSLKKELRDLVQEEKFAIIQTTHCMCIHNLSRPHDMKCQLGLDFENLGIAVNPYISRCKGYECTNAIFLEEDMEVLDKLYGHIDDEIKTRLERNTYIMRVGGIESVLSSNKIINSYREYKLRKVK
ncbi:site-specific integrase [Aliarcobacter butzleri]|uniref:site-specific integrase n=1 Tax=Aliarcobacter butzleri TaxID=28197 RepID=UPI001EDC1870|nr:site-specific integrase [Aliarcobacter butzleri]MCG3664647.1 site-specific integrase [Aliarcobacter butzleri]